ncbi:MAG: hypothetical protein FWH48_03630 [Oscillospiraceae bacterium]|nr:hypothetical protein [Oscillospiraceae bacterium]
MNEPVKKGWYKLDNAAKIFPPTSSRSDTRVFRFCCELVEDVKEAVLQSALDLAIEDFPGFACVLKRGVFWYYLEQSELRPQARKEENPPCSTIYLDKKSLLFEVTWHGHRINLEVYHVLTDGTGAVQFLRAVVLNYLKLAHPEEIGEGASFGYDASATQKASDGFSKYYDRSKKSEMKKNPAAYQLKGAKEQEWRLNIIKGNVSSGALLAQARKHGATITAFVAALFMRAIYDEMSVNDRKRPVVLSIPVNLRNFFDSKSARNFFGIVDISYDFANGSGSLEDIVKCAKNCLSDRLNEEYLQARLNKLFGFERNFLIRLVPLAIKNIYMAIAYHRAAREFTASISNLGRIDMPPEARRHIKLFDLFSSTDTLQIGLCSYEDVMTISFTSPFVSTDIQRGFFLQLAKLGLSVEICANSLGNLEEETKEAKEKEGN